MNRNKEEIWFIQQCVQLTLANLSIVVYCAKEASCTETPTVEGQPQEKPDLSARHENRTHHGLLCRPLVILAYKLVK